MKNVGVYVRISTDEQNTEGQRHDLKRWLDQHGIKEDVVEWYEDIDSGEKVRRPQLQRLEADIHAGTIRTVIMWKTDRLSRNWLHGLNLCCAWAAKGVRVISTTQPIDLSGPIGQAVAGVFFAFGQIETEARRERQKLGIDAARRNGVYRGRKAGTTKGKPSRAKELRAKGLAIGEIATALACSHRTVHRYLEESLAGA